ncbi:MAG: hypothetical protein RIE77_10680 [Phycisphaerales bacterium]
MDTPESPTLQATPTVPDRLPCVGCGYDLIGLPEDGACPECGVAIGRSISGDHLFASSKEHRQRLARGADYALGGVWAGWMSLAFVPVSVFVDATIARLPLLLSVSLALLGTGQGWLRLISADPDRIGDVPERWVPRLVLRLYAWTIGTLGPALVVLWFLLEALLRTLPTPRASSSLLLVLAALACLPTLAVSGPIASEVATLARRLLEGDLADRSRGLAVTGWAGMGSVFAATTLAWARPAGPGWVLEPIAWIIAFVLMLAWGVQYHTLVRALRLALATVAARP